uniref:Uncharacterized protein n=1 Tax=Meloidogyne incognita TaxID=6306 RepID=A0A914KWM6_MELIC
MLHFLAKFYAVAVSRLFLAKFYAVAVSRLFLAKFYAVEVEHQLNNISNSATLTNFFNSTASTQQHQLNQLQLNSINSTNFNSTNFNSTASTQPTTSTQQHLHSTTTSTQQQFVLYFYMSQVLSEMSWALNYPDPPNPTVRLLVFLVSHF